MALATLAIAAAACVSAARGDAEPRYSAVKGTLASMGLAQIGPAQRGTLGEGREARLRVDLAAQCVTIVVVGGDGVRDVDASLVDPAGKTLAHDTTKDPEATLHACVDVAGAYTIVVKMSAGGGSFVAAAWTGGAPAPSGSGSASASGDRADDGAAGTCASPLALASGATHATTASGEAEHSASCSKNEARELVYKLDVSERQRVVVDVVAQFDSVVYMRKGECGDTRAEVACNDDAPNADRSKLDVTVDAGTYYVFVDGMNREGGPFRMNVLMQDVPALAEVCRRARPLAFGQTASGTTHGGFDNVNASCGGGAHGFDAPYRLDLGSRARVRVTEHSDELAPVVHLRRVCADEQSEVACSDSGIGSEDATFVGFLPAGSYSVFGDARDRDVSGRYTMRAETSPELGSGVPGDGCGDAIVVTSSDKLVGDTFFAKDDVAGRCSGAGGPDVVYRVELARRSRVSARLDDEEGRHVLHLSRSCGDRASEIACGTRLDEALPAGVYFLAVDGLTADGFGRFEIDWRVKDIAGQESACKSASLLSVGQVVRGSTTGAGDRFATSCGGRDDSQASSDRVYKIVLASRQHVRLELSTPTWDGLIALRRSCVDLGATPRTTELACNNDADGPNLSRIDTTLEAGTYFVVVDGHGAASEGAFTLEYKK